MVTEQKMLSEMLEGDSLVISMTWDLKGGKNLLKKGVLGDKLENDHSWENVC